MNPITDGPDAVQPCIVWLYGDMASPEGDYCKICWKVFKFGGFAAMYTTLTTYFKAAPDDASILDEFLAARDVYVQQVNSGVLKMRVRGGAKSSLEAAMYAARQTVVDLVKSVQAHSRTKFRAMTIKRYSELHEGRSPGDDKVPTIMALYQGVRQPSALLRRHAEG